MSVPYNKMPYRGYLQAMLRVFFNCFPSSSLLLFSLSLCFCLSPLPHFSSRPHFSLLHPTLCSLTSKECKPNNHSRLMNFKTHDTQVGWKLDKTISPIPCLGPWRALLAAAPGLVCRRMCCCMSPFHKGNTGMWPSTKKPVVTQFVRKDTLDPPHASHIQGFSAHLLW